MNGKARIAKPFLGGLLMLSLAAPRLAAADEKKDPCEPKPLPASTSPHEMSPEAKLLPEPPDPRFFKADPCYLQPYDASEELKVYSGKKMIDRPRPPIEWGLRLYDRGAYAPRATWLGALNPIGFHFMSYGEIGRAHV